MDGRKLSMVIGYEAKRIFHNASGLGNYSRNLIRAMSQNYGSNKYILYNPSEASIPFGQFLPGVEERLPSFSNKLYANLWRQRFVSDRAKKDKVDVFHGLSAELPAGLQKANIPSVVTVHDLIFLRFPELYKKIDRKIYTKKLYAACQRADHIVAISQQTKKDLIDFIGLDPLQIRVIYQGCDPIYWKKYSKDEIESALQRFEIPEKFGLFVGTIEERKGIRKILEAVLATKIPMVLVGRQTDYWKKLIRAPRYKEILHLVHTPDVPENEDLAKLYHKSHFFVYPSIFEGFGIPVMEALISETAVITSNSSSLPEAAGPDSILIDPESQDEINEAMQKLWTSEELRKQVAESGREYALNFSDEKMASSWMHLYKELKA